MKPGASFFEASLSFAGKSDIAALLNQVLSTTVLDVELGDAVTSLDLKTTLKIVVSEEKSRSSMATVIGVGVGVAAAAFLVSLIHLLR